MKKYEEAQPDVVLIGAGIMCATLGTILRAVQPDWHIHVFERLDEVALESSDAWNNAGTGHSAFCELNYTPQTAKGIDIAKALKIAGQFERSRDFWASLVERGQLPNPSSFIHQTPHMSFVRGEDNVRFLSARYEALKPHHLFRDLIYSEDPAQLNAWFPLIMEGRDPTEPVAATKMEIGTDVNFGELTRSLFRHLKAKENFELHCGHEVRDIDREADGRWHISVKDLKSGDRRWLNTPFVFIGAGGGSLKLLEKSEIPEAKGFGGFPVSGQWLVCQNQEIANRHGAKVYGKAAVGAPPMSVPHLDTRMIDNKKSLLFGPYAGFSTRFLKHGSLLDLPDSITPSNIGPMIAAGWHNLSLTRYLLDQVTQSSEERVETLRDFMPLAKSQDWRLENAGQRVQIIKKDKAMGGILEFGTELVSSADGTLAALLGASPGASTSVAIMLDLLKRCFPDKLQSVSWQSKIRGLIPSYGQALSEVEDLAQKTRARSAKLLGL